MSDLLDKAVTWYALNEVISGEPKVVYHVFIDGFDKGLCGIEKGKEDVEVNNFDKGFVVINNFDKGFTCYKCDDMLSKLRAEDLDREYRRELSNNRCGDCRLYERFKYCEKGEKIVNKNNKKCKYYEYETFEQFLYRYLGYIKHHYYIRHRRLLT